MKNEIQQWLENPGRDYAEGVRLMEKYGKNNNLVRVFANRSPRFAMDDLTAELRRVRGTDDVGGNKEVVHVMATPKIPDVVVTAKQMVHDTWVKLSRIHLKMYDVGEGNGEEDVKARRRLMDEREPLIERYNSIYEAKEAYFAEKLTDAQLQEVLSGKTLEQIMKPVEQRESLPLHSLTDLQLAKKAKAAKAGVMFLRMATAMGFPPWISGTSAKKTGMTRTSSRRWVR